MVRYLPPKEYVPFPTKPKYIVKRKQSYYRYVDCYYSDYFDCYLSEYEWWFCHNGKWYRHVNQYKSDEPKTANFDDGVWGEPHLAAWLDSNGKSHDYDHPNKKKGGKK